ncbi:MAG TPA: N-acetyltransferase [Cytophagales bacterium]|nr:N-acetyltransferase [Cytophagales bacterium]HAP62146.1 N-acetyltransferase [Cytophagales bacterium]
MNAHLFQSPIALVNKRALLVPFADPRNEELRSIIYEADIWQYMGMSVATEADFEAYRAQTLEDQRQGHCYPFLVIDKRSNAVAGSTRYGYLNTASEKCEIGWTWYGKAFQGTGLNKACKYALLSYGFETVGFRRIQFSADEENLRSQRAIEKLGAQREGLFRNNYIDAQGRSRNDVYFSIVREEWPTLKQTYFQEYM